VSINAETSPILSAVASSRIAQAKNVHEHVRKISACGQTFGDALLLFPLVHGAHVARWRR
jgi:hypothetical protein